MDEVIFQEFKGTGNTEIVLDAPYRVPQTKTVPKIKEHLASIYRVYIRDGILELRRGDVPPKVAIDEAVRLAHWFGGARAPGFVNGVLDGIARTLGRL